MSEQWLESASDQEDRYFQERETMKTYQVYDAYTRADGTIRVSVSTNDNLDLGYPSECARWDFICKDREAFDTRCGKSHTGCLGCEVKVYLNSKEVK
jgi:hypothetical protein